MRKFIYILMMRVDEPDDEGRYYFSPYATSNFDNNIKTAERYGLEHHMEKIKTCTAEFEAAGGMSGNYDIPGFKTTGASSCILDEETQFYTTFLDH